MKPAAPSSCSAAKPALKVTGSLHHRGPREFGGPIGSIDTTSKDVQIGPVKLTADRLHLDGLDELEVVFDGSRRAHTMVVVHRVTATNVSLQIASKRSHRTAVRGCQFLPNPASARARR
jgi:hypothetical protein